MENQTVVELKQIAKRLNLHNYSKMCKKELIAFIRTSKGKASRPTPKPRRPAYSPTPKPRSKLIRPTPPKRFGSELPSYSTIKDDKPPNFYQDYINVLKIIRKNANKRKFSDHNESVIFATNLVKYIKQLKWSPISDETIWMMILFYIFAKPSDNSIVYENRFWKTIRDKANLKGAKQFMETGKDFDMKMYT